MPYAHRDQTDSATRAPNTACPFAQALHRREFRRTSQREAIWDVFQQIEGHPTTEELLEEALRRGHDLSMATVYRTLKLFLQVGIVRKLEFGDGLSRYERRSDTEPHLHFICERCGRTFDVTDQDIIRQYHRLAARHDFAINRQATCLYGLCASCAEKKRASLDKPFRS